jgi:hypothetical protein
MKTRQTVFAALGAAALAGVVGACFMLASGDATIRGAGAVSPSLGWVMPLVSLVVIVGVTVTLLSRDSSRPPSDPPVPVPCQHCGRSVLPDWRLCPYCGAMLQDEDGTREPEAG